MCEIQTVFLLSQNCVRCALFGLFWGFLGVFLWGLFSFCLGFSFFLFLFFCRVLSDYISMIALKLYIASRLSHLCSGCWWDRCVSNMASLKREDPMKLHAAR